MIDLLLFLIDRALFIYSFIVLATVALSWLIGLNIVNGYRPEVRAVQRVCYQLTEPLLAPIRDRLPAIGGLDLSPVVLLLGLQFASEILRKVLTGTLLV